MAPLIFRRFSVLLLTIVLGAGCASPFSLKPASSKPQMLDGQEVETIATPKCVFQARGDKPTSGELIVFVKVTNKSDKAFDFDPSTLLLTGNLDVMKNPPIKAVNPDAYVKELGALAETYDARTKLESYQGIDQLGSLNSGKSDREIEMAKKEYESKQKDAKKAADTAADLRARAAMIQTTALRKTSIKPGESIHGPVAFKSAELYSRGAVSVIEQDGPCAGEMRFLLAR